MFKFSVAMPYYDVLLVNYLERDSSKKKLDIDFSHTTFLSSTNLFEPGKKTLQRPIRARDEVLAR